MNMDHFAAYKKAQDEGRAAAVKVWEGRLITDNRLLAMQLCNRYRQGLAAPLSMEDAEQAALIGLLRALRKYDPAQGRFSNLAGWWVRHELQVAGANEDRLMDGLQGRKRRGANRKMEAHLAQHGAYGEPAAMGVRAEDVDAHRSQPSYVRAALDPHLASHAQDKTHNQRSGEFLEGLVVADALTAEEAMVAREDALEAIDAVPSSRQIPVWALAQRPAFGRLASAMSLEEQKILEDLARSGDTVARVARRHHRPKAVVLKLWRTIEAQVRDAWHEGVEP